MAQRDPLGQAAGDVVTVYLQERATEFLRSLREHRENGDAGIALRRAARRISGTLHTFRPLLEPEWADALRPELAWLTGTLAREQAYAARLERLLAALQRLSGARVDVPGARNRWLCPPSPELSASPGGTLAHSSGSGSSGQLTVGAAKAGALLDRQLTLARTRAHSSALQALGSSRFHAVADSVAVLASEVPLAVGAIDGDLKALAGAAEARLSEAVDALPLGLAGHPYNAEALVHGLAADAAPQSQDAPWNQVRSLLRLHRYAREVLEGDDGMDVRLIGTGQALDQHRDAAEAAAAAASAARTPRIAPATAYALGVLHADQRHEVEAARFAFQRVWQREAAITP